MGTSVSPWLLADPTKTFTYVEIAFFARWWAEQAEERRMQVRNPKP
jgi:alpha-mannosidase/lysosomal alpha-mannosidase